MWYWLKGFLIIEVTTFRRFLCFCSVWFDRLLDAIYLLLVLFLQIFLLESALFWDITQPLLVVCYRRSGRPIVLFVLYTGVWLLGSTSCTIASSSSSSLVAAMFWSIPIHLRTAASSRWSVAFCHCPRHCHCINVFPFYLKYLSNAEYTISSWPVASKSTLMIPSNFLCIWS
jgi:hypothetical protein